jgi:signal peptidase I
MPESLRSKFWSIAITAVAFVSLPLILQVLSKSTYPVLVIKSQSMYPAFSRGDIVILSNRTSELRVGEIPAVWFRGQDEPMIHRIVKVWPDEGEGSHGGRSQTFVTKGDNNEVDDVVLYPSGRSTVHKSEVMGMAVGYLPGLGWPALWLREIWWCRWVAIGTFALWHLAAYLSE